MPRTTVTAQAHQHHEHLHEHHCHNPRRTDIAALLRDEGDEVDIFALPAATPAGAPHSMDASIHRQTHAMVHVVETAEMLPRCAAGGRAQQDTPSVEHRFTLIGVEAAPCGRRDGARAAGDNGGAAYGDDDDDECIDGAAAAGPRLVGPRTKRPRPDAKPLSIESVEPVVLHRARHGDGSLRGALAPSALSSLVAAQTRLAMATCPSAVPPRWAPDTADAVAEALDLLPMALLAALAAAPTEADLVCTMLLLPPHLTPGVHAALARCETHCTAPSAPRQQSPAALLGQLLDAARFDLAVFGDCPLTHHSISHCRCCRHAPPSTQSCEVPLCARFADGVAASESPAVPRRLQLLYAALVGEALDVASAHFPALFDRIIGAAQQALMAAANSNTAALAFAPAGAAVHSAPVLLLLTHVADRAPRLRITITYAINKRLMLLLRLGLEDAGGAAAEAPTPVAGGGTPRPSPRSIVVFSPRGPAVTRTPHLLIPPPTLRLLGGARLFFATGLLSEREFVNAFAEAVGACARSGLAACAGRVAHLLCVAAAWLAAVGPSTARLHATAILLRDAAVGQPAVLNAAIASAASALAAASQSQSGAAPAAPPQSLAFTRQATDAFGQICDVMGARPSAPAGTARLPGTPVTTPRVHLGPREAAEREMNASPIMWSFVAASPLAAIHTPRSQNHRGETLG